MTSGCLFLYYVVGYVPKLYAIVAHLEFLLTLVTVTWTYCVYNIMHFHMWYWKYSRLECAKYTD